LDTKYYLHRLHEILNRKETKRIDLRIYKYEEYEDIQQQKENIYIGNDEFFINYRTIENKNNIDNNEEFIRTIERNPSEVHPPP